MPEDVKQSLFPLDGCWARSGEEVPVATFLDGAELPEPYRTLLVHDRDMTGTLQAHHGDTLRLDTLRSWEEGDVLIREVFLRKENDGKVVEYGAIEIYLARLPGKASDQVRAGERPLGAILNDFEIPYRSRPRGFFRIPCTPRVCNVFCSCGGKEIYGRTNQLVIGEDQVLADVTELLPR